MRVTKFAIGSLAQLNRASDYGSEGYRFESCANHEEKVVAPHLGAFFVPHALCHDVLEIGSREESKTYGGNCASCIAQTQTAHFAASLNT